MPGYIDKVNLYTDGGCRGNPGPGAIAYRILDENDNELDSGCECIGETTNNRAEYRALIKGLECAVKHTREVVNCYLDSELVVNQVKEKWKIKDDDLKKLFYKVLDKESVFKEVNYVHLRRTHHAIQLVDEIVNQTLDGITR